MSSTEIISNLALPDVSASEQVQVPSTPNVPMQDHGNNTVKKLLAALQQQSDIVIDFSSLKNCLNPTGIGDGETAEQELDYEEFLDDLIDKQVDKLPNLQKLTIRREAARQRQLKDEQYDHYAQLNYGIMQMSCLSELDFCELPAAFHDQLELWNLHNLKSLSITKSQLKALSGSVGRLSKLEELDLSFNQLSSLPITLSFCKQLNTLDLHHNKFRQLPGVVLQLPKLHTLRRLDNPLTPRYQCHGPHYTRKINKGQPKKDEKKVYQPLSLQASCTTVVFTSKLNYWKTNLIGPLQCKTLDSLATQFISCDSCSRMLPDQERQFGVEVLLVTFAELSGVPFLLSACNETCQQKLLEKYGEMNVALQKQLDSDYEESIKRAMKEVEEGKVTLGPAPGPYTPPPPWNNMPPWPPNRQQQRRRRKQCSIM